ncbi:MAG: tetratricopeptide repeat protein [Marinobacterium sp.]|nr:tetratricopeptide repeat protein [Marinobacterium sp.]
MSRTLKASLLHARLMVRQAPDHVENWLALGRLLQLEQHNKEAVSVLEQAWARAADQQRWALYLSIAEALINLYQQLGRAEEFVLAITRVLAQPAMEAQGLDTGALRLRLGQFYLSRRDYPLALYHLRQALQYARQQHDPLALGEAYFLLGQLFRWQQQLERAEEHFRSALELATEQQQAARMANLYGALAGLLQKQERWKEAEAMQHNAVKIGRLLKQQAGLAQSLGSLGALQLQQEAYGKARKHLEESLTLYCKLENRRGEADQRTNLGIIASHGNELDEAETHLQQAWRLYQQLGFDVGVERTTSLLLQLAQLQRPDAVLQ